MAIAENQITLEIVADGQDVIGASVDVDYNITEVIEEYAIGTESGATGLWGTEVPDLTEENPKLWYRQRVTWIDETITYNPSENGVIKKEVTETGLLSKNEIATAQSTADDANAAVSELEEIVNNSSVENLPSYISIDTSTDGSNVQLLVIGTGAFHTVVSATGLRFYMNESKANILADNWAVNSESDMAVAYLTNNKLKINRAVIVEGMEIGDPTNGSFEWRKRYVPANGGNNFYLKWLG